MAFRATKKGQMSRNIELLQRAQRLMERTALLADFGPERSRDGVHGQSNGNGSTGTDVFAQSQRATLPMSHLRPAQKRELLRLITALFRPGDLTCPRMIQVSAIDGYASASWISACLGELLAVHLGESVCVVDANLRESDLYRVFEIPAEPGLSDAIRDAAPLYSCCRQVSNQLWVLTAGSRSLEDVSLVGDAMRHSLEQLRRDFACSLVVGPPVGQSADSIALAQMVDGVLLVIEAGATRRDQAAAAKEALVAAKAPLLGAVLNNRTFPIPDWLYQRL
jgi:Mrp family chromosome partitioning ATPase